MITGKRFVIDKNGYLIDSKTGNNCKGKIYNRSTGQYTDELDFIKMPDDITDFRIDIPSGDIWVTKDYMTRYGILSFQYFGERSLEENELYNSLVQEALLGNIESAVELSKKLAIPFFTEEEIELFDSKLKDYGERCYFISQLINCPELQLKFIQQGAYKGDAYCQSELAHYYENGYMVEQNYKLAFQWYKKAAEQINAFAMERLSLFYGFGYIKPNLKKRFYWTKKTAERGDISLYENLINYYANGIGCAKNYSKTIYWSKKICKMTKGQINYCCSNYGRILYRLGYCYFYGRGCKKNKQTAYDYFCKSAEEEYWQAYDALSYFYEAGIIVQKNTKKIEEMLKKKDEAIKKDIRNELLRQDCYVIASKTNGTDTYAVILDAMGSYSLYQEQGIKAVWLKELSSQENIKIFENGILTEYIYKHGSEKLKEIIRCWINKNNIKFETEDLIFEILKLKAIDKDFTEFISSYL